MYYSEPVGKTEEIFLNARVQNCDIDGEILRYSENPQTLGIVRIVSWITGREYVSACFVDIDFKETRLWIWKNIFR